MTEVWLEIEEREKAEDWVNLAAVFDSLQVDKQRLDSNLEVF